MTNQDVILHKSRPNSIQFSIMYTKKMGIWEIILVDENTRKVVHVFDSGSGFTFNIHDDGLFDLISGHGSLVTCGSAAI